MGKVYSFSNSVWVLFLHSENTMHNNKLKGNKKHFIKIYKYIHGTARKKICTETMGLCLLTRMYDLPPLLFISLTLSLANTSADRSSLLGGMAPRLLFLRGLSPGWACLCTCVIVLFLYWPLHVVVLTGRAEGSHRVNLISLCPHCNNLPLPFDSLNQYCPIGLSFF